MTAPLGLRLKSPAHPGGFVKTEIVEALGLSVTRAAAALGVTRAALSALVNQRAHLSPDMALRIGTGQLQHGLLALQRREGRPQQPEQWRIAARVQAVPEGAVAAPCD